MLEVARCAGGGSLHSRRLAALAIWELCSLDGSRNLSSHITHPGVMRSKEGMLRMLEEALLPFFIHATFLVKTNTIYFLKPMVPNNFVLMQFCDISTL